MSPTLFDNDIVITTKTQTRRHKSLRLGLIYVVNHSELGLIIKRLDSFDKHGRAVLSGDNPASTSPALIGTVEPERLTRRALLVFGKQGLRKL